MATQEFTNLGPIYTTQAKFDALKTAGQLEIGREYKIVDWEAQEKLVSGTNIKTINNGSILGSGDISLKTFSVFPDDIKTDGTLQELLDSVNESTGAIAGMGYLGSISGECTPFGYGNAECKIEYMIDGGPALLTVSSSNVTPYFWVVNSYSGEGWKKFSDISVSETGTATSGVSYITIDGEEKKFIDPTAVRAADIVNKLNKLPNVDDPTDPGYGYPYWIPYNFSFTPESNDVKLTLNTLTLDNNLLKKNFDKTIPTATTSVAGFMSAQDKVDLANKQDIISDIDTIRTNAADGPIARQGVAECKTTEEALDTRLKEVEKAKEPELKVVSGKNFVYANGVALRIVDNNGTNIAYYVDSDNVQKTLAIPYGTVVHGGGLGTATNKADFPSSMIIMESGNLKAIYGGSRAYGNVGSATIIVNSGTLTEGPNGGGAAPNANEMVGVGEATIIMNGGTSLTVYGGGMGRATVGKAHIAINDGTHKWITAGGSNGVTGKVNVTINGGNIVCLQTVNRGIVEEAAVTINDGTITNLYAGGETGDTAVTGKCEKAILKLEGGTFTLNKGTYGGVEDSSRCSGYYLKNVITSEAQIAVAAACNLISKELTATQAWVEGKGYLTSADVSNKLDILPNVDDPTDPGYGYPYWIPYNFATSVDADKVDITLKTLTLNNKLLKHEFTNSFPTATTTTAGTLSAADKVKLDAAVTEQQLSANYRKSVDQDVIDASKQDVISDLDTIRSGAAAGSTAVQPADISDMATKTWTNDQKMPWLGDHGKVPTWKTEDPGAGYAFHIPYRFGFTPDLNKLDIKIYTITADGNNTYDEWDNTLPPANSIEAMSYQNAGLMTSSDATAIRTTIPTQLGGLSFKVLTQVEYDALPTKDSTTLYIIK